VQRFHPSSWADVASLKRLSSACIANLHTELVATYICIFIISLAFSAFVFTIESRRSPYLEKDNVSYLLKYIISGYVGFTIYGILFYISATRSGFINFTGKPSRVKADFDGIYIDIGHFWFSYSVSIVLSLLTIAILILAVLCSIYLAQLTWRRFVVGHR
jgi:hypothetical protein